MNDIPAIKDWITPAELSIPGFSSEKVSEKEADPSNDSKEPPRTQSSSDQRPDLSVLLNLLGGQNSSVAPILGLLNGEKLDIISLLPLIMQLIPKKNESQDKAKPPPPPERLVNLDDYSMI